MEKVFHANRNQQKAREAILISDKQPLKWRLLQRHRRTLHNDQGINPRRHNNCKYICIQQEHINIRQILTAIKGEIDSNTVIVGNFNIPFSSMDRSSRQKINKETQTLNDTSDQMDLIFTEHSIQNQQNTHSSKCTRNIL